MKSEDKYCSECKDRLYPQNPEEPFFVDFKYGGRYLKPLCYYCHNYEPPKSVERNGSSCGVRDGFAVRGGVTSFTQSYLTQIQSHILYLEKKLNEHIDRAKKSYDKKKANRY